jgi:P2-related tail formation protein
MTGRGVSVPKPNSLCHFERSFAKRNVVEKSLTVDRKAFALKTVRDSSTSLGMTGKGVSVPKLNSLCHFERSFAKRNGVEKSLTVDRKAFALKTVRDSSTSLGMTGRGVSVPKLNSLCHFERSFAKRNGVEKSLTVDRKAFALKTVRDSSTSLGMTGRVCLN